MRQITNLSLVDFSFNPAPAAQSNEASPATYFMAPYDLDAVSKVVTKLIEISYKLTDKNSISKFLLAT